MAKILSAFLMSSAVTNFVMIFPGIVYIEDCCSSTRLNCIFLNPIRMHNISKSHEGATILHLFKSQAAMVITKCLPAGLCSRLHFTYYTPTWKRLNRSRKHSLSSGTTHSMTSRHLKTQCQWSPCRSHVRTKESHDPESSHVLALNCVTGTSESAYQELLKEWTRESSRFRWG